MNEELKKELEEIWKKKDDSGKALDVKDDLEKLRRKYGKGINEMDKIIFINGYAMAIQDTIRTYLMKKEEVYLYIIIKESPKVKEGIEFLIGEVKDLDKSIDRLLKLDLIKEISENGKSSENKKIYKYKRKSIDIEYIDCFKVDVEIKIAETRYKMNKINFEKMKDMIKLKEVEKNVKKIEKDIDEKEEEIKKLENKIYGTIISFMGIFIAIFGVLTINYNFLSDLSQRVSVLETALVAVIINFSLFVLLFFIFGLVKSLMNVKEEKFLWDLRKISISLTLFSTISIMIVLVSLFYLNHLNSKNKMTYAEKVLKVQEAFVAVGIEMKVDARNGSETQKLIKEFKAFQSEEINIEINDELWEEINENKEGFMKYREKIFLLE